MKKLEPKGTNLNQMQSKGLQFIAIQFDSIQCKASKLFDRLLWVMFKHAPCSALKLSESKQIVFTFQNRFVPALCNTLFKCRMWNVSCYFGSFMRGKSEEIFFYMTQMDSKSILNLYRESLDQRTYVEYIWPRLLQSNSI